jgi:hypothetical protein
MLETPRTKPIPASVWGWVPRQSSGLARAKPRQPAATKDFAKDGNSYGLSLMPCNLPLHARSRRLFHLKIQADSPVLAAVS